MYLIFKVPSRPRVENEVPNITKVNVQPMVLILDGNSENVAHTGKKLGLLGEKI